MADGSAPARKPRKMPAQKPATSEQEVCTPWDFIDAVETRFGRLDWDLAAQTKNCVVRNPDGSRSDCFFSKEQDSLKQNWSRIRGLLWLNPEFADFTPWVRKAAEEASPTSRILVLTKHSPDSHWWWDWVVPHAITLAVAPRVKFVGHTSPFPAPLSLNLFGMGASGAGLFEWRARRKKSTAP